MINELTSPDPDAQRAGLSRLSPDHLAAIRERAEKATPGPWEKTIYGGQCDPSLCGMPATIYGSEENAEEGDEPEHAICEMLSEEYDTQHDAAFIAHAPTDIAALLAENDRKQAIIDKLPVTEDGVSITPGMTLWAIGGGGRVYSFIVLMIVSDFGGSYSTRAAAIAALAAKEGGDV